MSLRWERFAGDTSSFAMRLAFHHDPDHGAGASPEMAESWGAFQIWVRGKNLCAHVDQGETLQHSHWYLLPLLEWFSANWDPLLHEGRLPAGRNSSSGGFEARMPAAIPRDSGDVDGWNALEAQFEWQQRHELRAAREGGVFPDTRFRRVQDRIEVSWTAAPVSGAEELQFLATEGTEYEDPLAVAEPMYEVLSSSADWLHRQLPASQRYKQLVANVGDLLLPERNQERVAWLAGLGATRSRMIERWASVQKRIESLGKPRAVAAVLGTKPAADLAVGGSCQAALLFGSTSPTISERDVKELASMLLDTYEQSPVDGLAEFVIDEPIDATRPPWQHGYDLAEELLDNLGTELADSDASLEAWLRDWHVQVGEISLDDPGVRAVAFASDHHAPTIMMNRNHWSASVPTARRFTLAHELCHLLHDRSYGACLAMASGAWAPRAIEKRANAFAAWLLMPPDRVQRAAAWAKHPLDTHEGIKEISAELRVSKDALVEHLHNLGFINEDDRVDLRSYS